MGQRSKLSFVRHFGWKLILSLIIAGLAAFLLNELFYPYQFNLLETTHVAPNQIISYHDFNDDGLSECVELCNFGPTKNYTLIKNWNGGIIDQTNYWETISLELMYADVTGDRYDEIIACTQKDDSVFIYVHDITTKRPIINRFFLFCLKEPLSPHYKQADLLPGCLADSSVYDQKVLIFIIRSFGALLPRSIFAFDIQSQKIIHHFETHSTLGQIYPYDLTGDGIDEIVVTGVAYGNVHYPAEYSDDKCWLFVLDQKLNPVFPPLSFSEYPSEFACFPVEIHSDKYLLAVPDYLGEKNLHDYTYLIDAKGKIHLRVKSPFPGTQESGPALSYLKNPTEIYGVKGSNELIKLNEDLEPTNQTTTSFNKIITKTTKDLNADGKEELLCVSENYFLVYDENINLLAKYPIPNNKVGLSFRENGPNKPVEIGISVQGKFYLLSFIENKLYSYFPLLLAGLAGLIFLTLVGSQKLITSAVNHSKMLKYIRYDSSDGILVLDNHYSVVNFNKRFIQVLNLHRQPEKGDDVVSILNHHHQILEIIRKCKDSGEQIDQKIKLSAEEPENEYEISVQPFKYPFKKGLNYLVIIRSYGSSSHSDKVHTWSRAVQKMAHDIKTPLSTVSLNLKVLQNRLEKIQLSETEHDEISDDIKMMRTELDNIQSMTKNFLKFSNLDKPHSQAFNINSIINATKEKFQSYLNEDLSIEITIDKDVKPVWADPQQLEMVFNILLENSLAAMQGNGLISINVSPVQYLDKTFSESVEIEVADTGPGIKKENTHRIFEPYYSTKPEGTGMGLAIAKKIIEDNGGTIEVHSKPDFGAVFRFSIPVLKE
jgi:nitrogen-specific signal transduction histidine kinase